jgi:hypothetical protein
MRTGRFILSILLCSVMALGASTLLAQPSSGTDELLLNGGFEEGWSGWEKYSLGRGYASLDPVDPYEGQYSLAIQGTPTPQAGVVYGSGVRQTIEKPALSLDMEFAFWVKPWVSGKGVVDIKAMITLYTTHQITGAKVLKLMYYVAWLPEAESWANVRPDEADYLIQSGVPLSWNYFQTSVINDFETRWGSATEYSTSKIVLTLEITVGYPGMNTEYANWDDISLMGSQVTSTETRTISTTTIQSTTSPTTSMTTTVPITEATSTTGQGGIIFFTQPGLTTVFVAGIVVAISVAAIMLRRRQRSLPTRPPQLTVKYCINCGSAIATTAKYCPKCGSEAPNV